MRLPILIAAALVLTGLVAATPIAARPDGGTPARSSDAWSLCAAAVDVAERRKGIPDRLLTAISLAESGRRHPDRRVTLAWPWTVMAEGNGQYLPTKAAAIDRVRRLQARGVRNIDVGCMQVNLKYHPDAFATLDQAFDPAANAGYAARFLAALRVETGSWLRAMARYHSATPKYAEPYRAKVAAIWEDQRQRAGREEDRPARTPVVTLAAVDPAAAAPIRATRPAVRGVRGVPLAVHGKIVSPRRPVRDAEAAARFAERRREQLASWRDLRRRLEAERRGLSR